MSKTFRPFDPNQQLLLPAALQEWLPPGHIAYFISDVVDQLDLSAISGRYRREERGGPPYHPRMMVQALLYGYCTGGGLLKAHRRPAAPRGHRLPRAGGQQYPGTSAPSPTFARTTWRRWRTCSVRCWSCASGRGW